MDGSDEGVKCQKFRIDGFESQDKVVGDTKYIFHYRDYYLAK